MDEAMAVVERIREKFLMLEDSRWSSHEGSLKSPGPERVMHFDANQLPEPVAGVHCQCQFGP
jgi:hypothetical protein